MMAREAMVEQGGTGFARDVESAVGSVIERGRACARGAAGRPDLVAAHRWFNVAALRGSRVAADLRRDVAQEMTKAELVRALRDARASMAA